MPDLNDDPLNAAHLRGPGVWESLKGLLMPDGRLFDVVQVEVSSSCFARCRYCPRRTRAKVWKSAFMSARTYAAAWPLLRRTRRVHLQGWGEPLLHRRFFDFVALARRADCQVSSTTCGLVMDEATAERVVGSGLDVLAFSLAGVDGAGNAVREGAPFADVRDAIRMLQRVRKKRFGVHLEIYVAYMLLASRMEDLRGLPELLDELDLHGAVVSTMDFIPSPDLAHEAFLPGEREKIEKARVLLEGVAARAASRGRALYYALPRATPRSACLERIERSLYIAADGSVSPCVYTNLPTREEDPLRRVYGNVNDGDPLRVWHSPEYAGFRNALLTTQPDDTCRDCPKRYAVGNRG